ncbi:14272_t:CDS:10, partial [Ambispora leptoticha]
EKELSYLQEAFFKGFQIKAYKVEFFQGIIEERKKGGIYKNWEDLVNRTISYWEKVENNSFEAKKLVATNNNSLPFLDLPKNQKENKAIINQREFESLEVFQKNEEYDNQETLINVYVIICQLEKKDEGNYTLVLQDIRNSFKLNISSAFYLANQENLVMAHNFTSELIEEKLQETEKNKAYIMSKGNKCSKCLQRLEEVRNKLANQVSITDPCYCAFQVPTQSFDCPPHVCKEKRCNQCNTSFVELQCPKCNAEQERKNQEQEKLELEQGINYLQSTLKTLKTMKGHPGYSEYTVQQAEKQLAEAKEKYNEIQALEAIANRTPQQEQELQTKREELRQLLGDQQIGKASQENKFLISATSSYSPGSKILEYSLSLFLKIKNLAAIPLHNLEKKTSG